MSRTKSLADGTLFELGFTFAEIYFDYGKLQISPRDLERLFLKIKVEVYMKVKFILEVEEVLWNFFEVEKIPLDFLFIIGFNILHIEKNSCIICSNSIHKTNIVEKEIYFLINHFAKQRQVSVEDYMNEILLETYLFLIDYERRIYTNRIRRRLKENSENGFDEQEI